MEEASKATAAEASSGGTQTGPPRGHNGQGTGHAQHRGVEWWRVLLVSTHVQSAVVLHAMAQWASVLLFEIPMRGFDPVPVGCHSLTDSGPAVGSLSVRGAAAFTDSHICSESCESSRS